MCLTAYGLHAQEALDESAVCIRKLDFLLSRMKADSDIGQLNASKSGGWVG
ncbi:hypothetical protein [Caproicibacter sp. BJN0012]|uniref:hypothetical protein n=1 Tax=Caproicibacter sp. BJN0012 TaxID=3110227 RepID=UPI002E108E61